MNRALYFALCCLAGVLFAVVVSNRGQFQNRISQVFPRGADAPVALNSPNPSAENLSLSFASGIAIASPSVVSVYTVQTPQGKGSNESTQTSNQRRSSLQTNQGSGVIIDSTGLIVMRVYSLHLPAARW